LPISTEVGPAIVTRERPAVAPTRVLRVLIVEDNVDAGEMLELAVAQLGHATNLVHDGAAAITAATEFAPDVIFLDIGLPVMNGYTVAQKLREMPQFRHVHIAAVTGWGQDEDRRKARDAGCDSHFTKPLFPATLADLLARIAQGTPEGPEAVNMPRTRLFDSGSAT
jgi:CheY-like chemotaxis protein